MLKVENADCSLEQEILAPPPDISNQIKVI